LADVEKVFLERPAKLFDIQSSENWSGPARLAAIGCDDMANIEPWSLGAQLKHFFEARSARAFWH
jgi:hypothetical protein